MQSLAKSNFELTAYLSDDIKYGAFWQKIRDEANNTLKNRWPQILMQIEIQFKRKGEVVKKSLLLLITCICFTVSAKEQSVDKEIAVRVSKPSQVKCGNGFNCKSPLLAKFYANRKYKLAWIDENNQLTNSGQLMIAALESSYQDGFDPRAYHISQIHSMLFALDESEAKLNKNLLLNLDFTISDGMLLYLNNLVYGWLNGSKLYPDWPVVKKNINLLDVAGNLPQSGDISKNLVDVSPKYPGYQNLREKLMDYYQVASNGGWETIPDGDVLQEGSSGDRVALLQKRLYISGELSGVKEMGEFDKKLKQALIKFQENSGLEDDGVVGKQTLNALNVSVKDRIRQIELNMDRMRFLPDVYPADYVIVNVPDYSLEAFTNGKSSLLSPVVVGKTDHKTCILNSQITTIELNPFWNIPHSIASNEILPELKVNPKYLSDNDIKVFKVTNGKYNEVDPKNIDWKQIESANLNFRFRQNPGEENALGKLKFIFPNNCSIYLHDSLFTELFDEAKRGYSHGCIRVGQPIDLATTLLSSTKDWDGKAINSELAFGKHKFVKLASPINLYIIYLTAWYDDSEDFVQFRDDIYSFDKLSNYPLYMPRKTIIKRSDTDSKESTESS